MPEERLSDFSTAKMSSWFRWARKPDDSGLAGAVKAEEEPLFKDGIYTQQPHDKVTKLTFEDILRETHPTIADRYDPAQPKAALDEAIEEAVFKADTAAELAAKAKGFDAEAETSGEAHQAASDATAAAVSADKNVRRLAAAFESKAEVAVPTYGSGAGWYRPPKGGPESSTSTFSAPSPHTFESYTSSAAAEEVVIDTDYLALDPSEPANPLELSVDIPPEPTPSPAPESEPEPEADTAPYIAVEPEVQRGTETPSEASASSQAPMYPAISTNGQVDHSQGRGRQGQGNGYGNGRVYDGIEPAEESSAPNRRSSATARDPLLEPLVPEEKEKLLRRWKRFLGWGEQLAGESMLDDVRLASLDVFRGLVIAGFILVADSGARFPALNYSAWNGLSFGDFVDPFFLFIVGVSLAIAFKRVPSRRHALYKIIVRTVKIFIIGLFIQGGYYHGPSSLEFGVSLTTLRYSGVLQRVAIAFFIVGLSEVAVMKSYRETPPEGFLQLIFRFMLHWGIAILLALLYLGLTYFLYVPDWTFALPESTDVAGPVIRFVAPISANTTTAEVRCGVVGDFGPACNGAAYIDRLVLGINHMSHHPTYLYSKACSADAPYAGPPPPDVPAWCQAPFDAEGIIPTIGGVLTVFAGLHFGHVLTHFEHHWVRMSHASIFSAILLAAGWGLQYPLRAEPHRWFPQLPRWLVVDYDGMPLNKQLYSLSFMCFTAGVAGLALCVIYILTDVLKVRFYTKIFEWIGQNPLLVFVLAACGLFEALVRGFYWESPDSNLQTLLQKLLTDLIQDADYANLVGSGLKVVSWALLAGLLALSGHTWNF